MGFGSHRNSRLGIHPARNTGHAGSRSLVDNFSNVSRRPDWYHFDGVDFLFVSRFWRAISDPAVLGSSSVLDDRSDVGVSSMVCRRAEVMAEVHKGKGHLTIGRSEP